MAAYLQEQEQQLRKERRLALLEEEKERGKQRTLEAQNILDELVSIDVGIYVIILMTGNSLMSIRQIRVNQRSQYYHREYQRRLAC